MLNAGSGVDPNNFSMALTLLSKATPILLQLAAYPCTTLLYVTMPLIGFFWLRPAFISQWKVTKRLLKQTFFFALFVSTNLGDYILTANTLAKTHDWQRKQIKAILQESTICMVKHVSSFDKARCAMLEVAERLDHDMCVKLLAPLPPSNTSDSQWCNARNTTVLADYCDRCNPVPHIEAVTNKTQESLDRFLNASKHLLGDLWNAFCVDGKQHRGCIDARDKAQQDTPTSHGNAVVSFVQNIVLDADESYSSYLKGDNPISVASVEVGSPLASNIQVSDTQLKKQTEDDEAKSRERANDAARKKAEADDQWNLRVGIEKFKAAAQMKKDSEYILASMPKIWYNDSFFNATKGSRNGTELKVAASKVNDEQAMMKNLSSESPPEPDAQPRLREPPDFLDFPASLNFSVRYAIHSAMNVYHGILGDGKSRKFEL